jgi:hypothetical protein
MCFVRTSFFPPLLQRKFYYAISRAGRRARDAMRSDALDAERATRAGPRAHARAEGEEEGWEVSWSLCPAGEEEEGARRS